ncbi:MAG: hypothetical protein ACOYOJ_20230, partial [Alsobacter sp.]
IDADGMLPGLAEFMLPLGQGTAFGAARPVRLEVFGDTDAETVAAGPATAPAARAAAKPQPAAPPASPEAARQSLRSFLRRAGA